MKKLITILCIILTACSLLPQKKEERFVNPIFYQPLEGLKYKPDLYKIRPDKLFIQNFYGYNTTVNCEMLENTMDTVVLKCLHTPEPPNTLHVSGGTTTTWTYKFYIWPEEEQDSELGTDIRVYHYPRNDYEQNRWSSYSNLFVYKNFNSYMKVWGDAVNTFDEIKDINGKNSD